MLSRIIGFIKSDNINEIKKIQQESTTIKWNELLGAEKYRVFLTAVETGNLPITKFLLESASLDQRQKMLIARDNKGEFASFRKACNSGNIEVVQFLWKLYPYNSLQSIIAADNYSTFSQTCRTNNLDIVEFILKNCDPNCLTLMLEAKDFLGPYAAFRNACGGGHIELVSFLWGNYQQPSQIKMVTEKDCYIFQAACKNDHLNIAKFLWENCLKTLDTQTLELAFKPIFAKVLENRQFYIIEFLLENLPANLCQIMLSDDKFRIFNAATNDGNISLRRNFLENNSDFNAERFNIQFCKLTQNTTLAKLLLTCKNLSNGLQASIEQTDMFSILANFVVGKNIFDTKTTVAVIKIAQSTLLETSSKALNSWKFYMSSNESRIENPAHIGSAVER